MDRYVEHFTSAVKRDHEGGIGNMIVLGYVGPSEVHNTVKEMMEIWTLYPCTRLAIDICLISAEVVKQLESIFGCALFTFHSENDWMCDELMTYLRLFRAQQRPYTNCVLCMDLRLFVADGSALSECTNFLVHHLLTRPAGGVYLSHSPVPLYERLSLLKGGQALGEQGLGDDFSFLVKQVADTLSITKTQQPNTRLLTSITGSPVSVLRAALWSLRELFLFQNLLNLTSLQVFASPRLAHIQGSAADLSRGFLMSEIIFYHIKKCVMLPQVAAEDDSDAETVVDDEPVNLRRSFSEIMSRSHSLGLGAGSLLSQMSQMSDDSEVWGEADEGAMLASLIRHDSLTQPSTLGADDMALFGSFLSQSQE